MEFMISVFECHQRLEQQAAEKLARQRIARTRIHRDFEVAEERLRRNYFYQRCKYTHRQFRRRFRMSRKLFLEIVEGIQSYYSDPLPDHFKFMNKGPDATGRQSISTLMRCTAAIRQLAYGNAPDAFDEYLQMSERTGRECLDNFNKGVMDLFMREFLRKPTWSDVQDIYQKHEREHDFPGMLGSIDCMH
jgi:hypothetical protein